MNKLDHLMLVFARPGCENGAEKLCEIAADIQYLNECVIPEMRKAGIKSMTIGEIVNFARQEQQQNGKANKQRQQ